MANTIGTIAAIPRTTGETRALNFNGKMLVMGGGRTAPNPSNEVDAYDPVANSWAVNSPVPAFANARRNFPTDTDGTTRIWLAGGYDADGIPTGVGGTVLPGRWNANANTDGNGNGYCYGDGNCDSHGNGILQRRQPPPQAYSNGDGHRLRHLQRRHYHQEFDLRQHRGLGQHHRLAHNGCSRFAACHAEAPRRRVRSASHDCKCG